MDLELSDEQVWIERVDQHAARPPVAARARTRGRRARRSATRLWEQPRRVRSARRRRDRARRGRAVPGRASARRSPRVGPVARQRRRPLRAGAACRRAAGRIRARCWTASPALDRAARAGRRLVGVRRRARPCVESAHRHARPPSSTRRASTISPSSRSSTASRAGASCAADAPGIELTPQSGLDATVAAQPSRRSPTSRSRRCSSASSPRRSSSGCSASGRCSPPPRPSARPSRIFALARALRRPSAGSSAGRSAATRRCATSWPTCTCGRRAAGRRSLYAAAALDDGIARRAADGVGRQGLRLARRARGRARLDAGVRRHRVHRGAPGPPLPATDHRPRAAVRRRRPPRARARPCPRRRRAPASADGGVGASDERRMTDELGFNDPDRPAAASGSRPGADAGDRRADAGRRSCTTRAGVSCDVALISGGKSNLTYRVACDAGEVILRRPPLGHILPTAHDMGREYRVHDGAREHGRAGSAHVPPRRRRQPARRAVLRDGARRRPHLPQRASPRLRRGAGGAPQASARRSSTCWRDLHTVDPGRGRAGRVRPPGRASWSASCGAGRSSGRRRRPPTCRRSTRCATTSSPRCPSSARARSSTATSGSTTRSCTRPRRARSSRCSTGR